MIHPGITETLKVLPPNSSSSNPIFSSSDLYLLILTTSKLEKFKTIGTNNSVVILLSSKFLKAFEIFS